MLVEPINRECFIAEKVLINIVWANVYGFIVFFSALMIFGIPYFYLWTAKGKDYFKIFPSIENIIIKFFFFITMFLVGIILHEIIHGFVFAMKAKNKFKSIKFGIMPKEKLFSPYCHCMEIVKINHYRISAIMPTLILGIIPATFSIMFGSFVMFLLGSVFISAGSGDLLMIIKMRKEKNNALIYDLPNEAGFVLYRPKN